MSDQRRRRQRAEAATESEEGPVGRRRYNTRSSVREELLQQATPRSGSSRAPPRSPNVRVRRDGSGDVAPPFYRRPVARRRAAGAQDSEYSRIVRAMTEVRARAAPGPPDETVNYGEMLMQRRIRRSYAAMSTGGRSAPALLASPRPRSPQGRHRLRGRPLGSTTATSRTTRATTFRWPSARSPSVNLRPSRGGNILSSTRRNSSRQRGRQQRSTATFDDIIGVPGLGAASLNEDHHTYPAGGTEPYHLAEERLLFQYVRRQSGIDLSLEPVLPNNQRIDTYSSDSEDTSFLHNGSDTSNDVFYSDDDRMETDSVASSESVSTASPHSLISLSFNAFAAVDREPNDDDDEDDDEDEEEGEAEDETTTPTLETAIITRNVANRIIFLHNNISVQLMSSMAALANAFSNHQTLLQTGAHPRQGEGGFRGFPPPGFSHLEPTRRRVPEGVDCQRAKLIDELNSNTSECIICTDTIGVIEQIWPCNNCYNIFHLPCIRRWAKTNKDTEMGGAWICPVCRRPKFCQPNKLRYRCLCGRQLKPKPLAGVTPHCCGKQCKRDCGLLCHPGPCKMTAAEAAAVSKIPSTSQVPANATGL